VVVADRCISTIPVQHLLPCLPDVPAQVAQAAGDLVYNSLACVALETDGPVPPISWLYVPAPSLGKTNRVSFPSNYSPRAAPPGCGSILAEITHRPGDEVSRMTDDELIGEATATVVAMGIMTKDRIRRARVMRRKFAYVVYDLDYPANIRTVKEHCDRIGIPLVGRFAQFEYLNMDGCIRSVMDFVKGFRIVKRAPGPAAVPGRPACRI
jgi:protoporphyrinogen oxidase